MLEENVESGKYVTINWKVEGMLQKSEDREQHCRNVERG